jgi:hypothetical protein
MKNLQKIPSLAALFALPLNKSALAQLSTAAVKSLTTNKQRINTLVAITAVERLLEAMKTQLTPIVEPFVVQQVERKQNRTDSGVKFNGRYYQKWDFSQDAKYARLAQEMEVIKQQIKAREDFLKQLAEPIAQAGITSHPALMTDQKFAVFIYLPE